ncbi:hypothetical protein ACIA8G_06085 [Lentzea sp. NPDC051213]|uniref:ORC-CDC6 family AAA ATPase n=1 Tax=Lentzea sp. NPDC051213 TaxID=3364126 RepID=UPI0037B92464
MTETSLLADMTVAAAMSGIILRSEQQPDLRVLEDVFVDTGVLAQLTGRNSQIMFGRRGTGKSHVLRVLAARSQRQQRELAVYADVRLLGSAQLMTEPGRGLGTRSVSIFKDLLSLLQQRLLEHSVSLDGGGLEEVSDFADSIRAVTTVMTQRETADEWQSTRTSDSGTGLKLSLTGASLDAQSKGHNEFVGKRTYHYNEIFESTVVFAEVSHHLDAAVAALGVDRLVLFIDEWASIPPDVQPYVAEFLKRTVFPSPKVTVKIASLEHQSTFMTRTQTGARIGFELGGDAFANLDLDDYYSHDRNPAGAATFMSELLYRHLRAVLPHAYLAAVHSVTSAEQLVLHLFDTPEAFTDLVRAGHGVVRDFLGIHTHAFFHSMRSKDAKITADAVHTTASEWFEIDKLANLSAEMYETFRRLVRDVVGDTGCPYFLLDRAFASVAAIRELYDLRLIHLVRRGLTRADAPGTRYLLYTLDVGAYAGIDGLSLDPADAAVIAPGTALPRELT